MIARSLDGHRIAGAAIHGVQLPVAVEPAGKRLRGLLETLAPDAALALGVAPGRPVVSMERVALNVLDFSIPDNRGRRYRDRPIRAGGPAAYFSTLPVRRILASLRRAGIPAELSNTAGTYLCNFAMYTLLDRLAEVRPRVPAGFIHVPQTPEASADRPVQASMSFETTRRAVTIALEEIAAVMPTRPRPRRRSSRSR